MVHTDTNILRSVSRSAFVSGLFLSFGVAVAADPVVFQGTFVTPDVTLAHTMGHVAVDGTTMLLGYVDADDAGAGKGAVYVVERQVDGKWLQAAKLLPQNGAPISNFGDRVALDGDTAAVGDGSSFQGSGSVTTFQRTGGNWAQTALINPPWGIAGGHSGPVALRGDDLLIGATTLHNGTNQSGGLFFYRRVSGVWTKAQGPLFPSDFATGGSFAHEVALDGDVAASSRDLGGRAYVYERSGAGMAWGEVAILTYPNAVFDRFGTSIAVAGDWLAVGAPEDDQVASNAGAVHLYKRVGPGQWVAQTKLVAPDGKAGASFGFSLSMRAGRLVVGARDDTVANKFGAGSAYVFELQPNGTWLQSAKLAHPSPANDDATGTFVGLASNGAIAVASPFDDQNGRGSVLMFDAQTLSVDVGAISLAAGGAQVLDVQAGQSHAGKTYIVAGSVTGTAPGLPIAPGLTLPLSYDAYTQFTLFSPNNAVLSNSLGTLGSGGGAQAAFALPAGLSPTLAGITVWHAFVVVDANSVPKLVSNPVAVQLVP